MNNEDNNIRIDTTKYFNRQNLLFDMKDADKLENAIQQMITSAVKISRELEEKLLVETIIDISRGVYKDYNDYVKQMEKLNREHEKSIDALYNYNKNQLSFNIVAKPYIITELLFNHIKNY